MIVLCKDFYPGVLYVTFEESEWRHESIIDSFREFREMLMERASNEPPMVLCFVGNNQVKVLPSILTYTFIVKQLIAIHSLLIENVARTAVFLPDFKCVIFFRILEQMMRPQRPRKFFNDLRQMEEWVVDENADIQEINLH